MDPSRIDTVSNMLGTVQKYQMQTHGVDHSLLSDPARMHFMRNYVLALHVEQAELLQELPWKPWRYATSDMSDVNRDNVIKEWTDCLVFLLDQALCLKISAEEIVNTFYQILTEKSKTQKGKTA